LHATFFNVFTFCFIVLKNKTTKHREKQRKSFSLNSSKGQTEIGMSVNFGSMMILQTLFPDESDDEIEKVLLKYNNDVEKSKHYLQQKGSKVSQSAIDAMKPIDISASKVFENKINFSFRD
jgi:hypothetical protein